MFAKLLALILALGLVACLLLASRQARLQAAHELADARIRIIERDNELWRLRARIAELTTPRAVETFAAKITPLQTIEPGSPTLLERAEGGGFVLAPEARKPRQ